MHGLIVFLFAAAALPKHSFIAGGTELGRDHLRPASSAQHVARLLFFSFLNDYGATP